MTYPLWGAFLLSVLLALVLRNRVYAVFLLVLLGVQSAIWEILFFPEFELWFAPGVALVHIHFLSLIRPRLRPLWWRLVITWPALFLVAATVLALPWAAMKVMGVEPILLAVPFVVAGFGLIQSLVHSPSEVGIGRVHSGRFQRQKTVAPAAVQGLRLGHLTDFHLGPFVSAKRARRAVERIVSNDPDLVLLTGDFMTMESQRDVEALRYALEPLAAMRGRVFACRGNHDLEAPETPATVCAELGISWLIDSAERVETAIGEVEIVGIDYRFLKVKDHIDKVFNQVGEKTTPRIVLLHDPSHFRYLPDESADLVLSGHTHGGQLGLLSLGVPFTVVGATGVVPDQGLFTRGSMRLYVNRGLGHYGFPLRIGVPAEESVLHVAFSDEAKD